MKYPSYIFLFVLLLFSFSCLGPKQSEQSADEIVQLEDTIPRFYKYDICIDSLNTSDFLIRNGDNMALIFSRLGFNAQKGDSLTRACADVLNPTKLRAGMHYTTFTTTDSTNTIKYIAFAKSMTDYAVIDLCNNNIKAYEFNKPITLQTHYVEGIINSSLWNELQRKGADPLLSLKIADVYAWQIDFFDVKEGDAYKVIYDVAFIDDTTALNIASIRGAIFTHKGKDFLAVPFTQDSVFEYFDEEGGSLRRAFLKAPLDFFRITSRFSNSRLHPVLKTYRAHHGVDYAAPVGTPVKSIGAGTVVEKAFQGGGGGNYLKVKHNSVYTTTYMHLSKFAKGIQKGSRVQQGEIIGYVGSTGLSTGPHLDFRVHKNGQPINPLNMESPPSLPVRPELLDSFQLARQKVLAEIESQSLVYQKDFLSLEEQETETSELTQL